MQQADIFQQLHSLTPPTRFAVTGSEPISIPRSYDWYNGAYLHVSGDLSLLGAVRESTYTCEPFFTQAIKIGYGEQVCNDNQYQTGTNAAPAFPHMEHCDTVYSGYTGTYEGVVTIPLACNLFGSDLGHGVPIVAMMFTPWKIECQWTPEVAEALQSGTLTLEIVVHEQSFCSLEKRNDHARRHHDRLSPKFESNNTHLMAAARIANGVFLWMN